MSGSSATLARVGWGGRAMDEAELRDDEVEVVVVDDRVDDSRGGTANAIASLSGPASGGVFLRRAGGDVLLGTCDSGLRPAMLERRFTASARQAATAALGDDILATRSRKGLGFALENRPYPVRVTVCRRSVGAQISKRHKAFKPVRTCHGTAVCHRRSY
jgi:hypothetical protein